MSKTCPAIRFRPPAPSVGVGSLVGMSQAALLHGKGCGKGRCDGPRERSQIMRSVLGYAVTLGIAGIIASGCRSDTSRKTGEVYTEPSAANPPPPQAPG